MATATNGPGHWFGPEFRRTAKTDPMQLKVTGKNLDVGDALREHVHERIDQVLDKLFSGGASAHITFEREGIGFRADCAIHLDSGIHLQSHANATDPYQTFDQAADKLEKRLRRYTRRLKDRHAKREHAQQEQARYVTFSGEEGAEKSDDRGEAYPAIVAETTTPLHTLSVAEAVMRLDLADARFVLFRNAAHGGLNVVYRRDDGNIGWVDPDRNI